MTIEEKGGFITCYNLQELIICELNQPLTEGKSSRQVASLKLMALHWLVWVITELLGQAPLCRFVKCQSIPPTRTARGHLVVTEPLHPIPVHHHLHPLLVLVTC